MKDFFARNLPLDSDPGQEGRWLLWGAVLGLAADLNFLISYLQARSSLWIYQGRYRTLRPDAVMMPFPTLLGFSLWGCFLAAIAMVGLAAWHYALHFRGSKSIYTMRRLPQRWELHQRCLTVPALAAAGYLLEAALLLGLDYLIYRLATPAQALQAMSLLLGL